MKLVRSILSITLCLSLTSITTLSAMAQSPSVQDSKAALQRGYRTGYSDGYMSGYRDSIDNAAKNIRGHREYTDAQRAYSKEYGSVEDYRDGYRQGFEIGYETGFEKRSFESAVPLNLARRGLDRFETQPPPTPDPIESQVLATSVPEIAIETKPQAEVDNTPITSTIGIRETGIAQHEPTQAATAEPLQDPIRKVSYVNDNEAIIVIPKDTELIIEIQEPLSTERNVVGDKFTAKIVSPYELEGAVIEGRIERITQPGRIKRRSEMLLAFDRVVLSEDRWSNFSAILTEVLPVKGDNVRTVDNEGSAVGKRSIKEDSIKIGATTGAGLGIGALTAGPVGAAVGAGVGAAFGVGAVVIERGKHIKLNGNQQLRIKTNFETRIR
ncbi:hypothetical protein BH24ACI3_BH24ACI3_11490 [soil metagenome]